MKEANKIIVYTDGGARGNPGPAGIGFVFYQLQGKKEFKWKEYGQTIGDTTNNEAEYQAVIQALKKLKSLVGSKEAEKLSVEIRMDSELIARQLSGKYRIDEDRLKILYADVHNLTLDFGGIVYKEIPREKNREADNLVNSALDLESNKLF